MTGQLTISEMAVMITLGAIVPHLCKFPIVELFMVL